MNDGNDILVKRKVTYRYTFWVTNETNPDGDIWILRLRKGRWELEQLLNVKQMIPVKWSSLLKWKCYGGEPGLMVFSLWQWREALSWGLSSVSLVSVQEERLSDNRVDKYIRETADWHVKWVRVNAFNDGSDKDELTSGGNEVRYL